MAHLGLGLGAAQVNEHSAPHNGFLVHGQDTVPAGQAIAGIDYAVSPALNSASTTVISWLTTRVSPTT